jgi:hypothetical protein
VRLFLENRFDPRLDLQVGDLRAAEEVLESRERLHYIREVVALFGILDGCHLKQVFAGERDDDALLFDRCSRRIEQLPVAGWGTWVGSDRASYPDEVVEIEVKDRAMWSDEPWPDQPFCQRNQIQVASYRFAVTDRDEGDVRPRIS